MMIALPTLGIVIVFALIGIFFAGKNEEVIAKRKWSGIVVFLFASFAILIYVQEKDKAGDALFFGFLLIIVAAFAAYLLNSIGHWIISFIATIMPDKSDR